jgi:hypothetical protein
MDRNRNRVLFIARYLDPGVEFFHHMQTFISVPVLYHNDIALSLFLHGFLENIVAAQAEIPNGN